MGPADGVILRGVDFSASEFAAPEPFSKDRAHPGDVSEKNSPLPPKSGLSVETKLVSYL